MNTQFGDMTPEQLERLRAGHDAHRVIRQQTGAGVLIFGALYTVMVFVAAILAHAAFARNAAIATAGLAYAAYAAQYPPGASPAVNGLLTGLSVGMSILAALFLLSGL